MLTQEEKIRYERQILLTELGEEGQEKLKQSRVLVVGAGGLGSAVLPYLAAAGVGTIGIADGDRVELSNMHRQVIHRSDSLGGFKAESAARALRELNPDVQVRVFCEYLTPENIAGILEDFDMVVDAVDRLEIKVLISDTCVAQRKPFVHAGIVRYGGQVMTYVPGKGPCLRCLLGETPEPGSYETCAQVGVLGAPLGVMGSLEATEVIKYLTGIGELLTGRMLFFDGLTMEMQITELGERSPHCSVCSRAEESFAFNEFQGV